MCAALTDDALDFAGLVDYAPEAEEVVPPQDAWLARRMRGFGASEIAVVLAALGRLPIEALPSYAQPRAKRIRVRGFTGGVARIWLEKAGLRSKLRAGDAAASGTARERELLRVWASQLDGCDVLPETVTHADAVPREWQPLVDRAEPRLTATPDAWARDIFGDLVAVELKCSVRPYDNVPCAHRWQIVTQIAVMGAQRGVHVEGPRWAATWLEGAQLGSEAPITRHVERVEPEVDAARQAARDGWAEVERVRAQWEAMR